MAVSAANFPVCSWCIYPPQKVTWLPYPTFFQVTTSYFSPPFQWSILEKSKGGTVVSDDLVKLREQWRGFPVTPSCRDTLM